MSTNDFQTQRSLCTIILYQNRRQQKGSLHLCMRPNLPSVLKFPSYDYPQNLKKDLQLTKDCQGKGKRGLNMAYYEVIYLSLFYKSSWNHFKGTFNCFQRCFVIVPRNLAFNLLMMVSLIVSCHLLVGPTHSYTKHFYKCYCQFSYSPEEDCCQFYTCEN